MNKYEGVIELIVRLLIKRDNKVLLCLNKKTGNFFLPGGHVEFGDTIEETIYKETSEELGWDKEDIKSIQFKDYLENLYFYKDGTEQHCELNMIFDIEIGDNVPVESKELYIGFEWIELENVNTIKILPPAIMQFIKN